MRRPPRIAILVAGFFATAWGIALLVQVLVGSERWLLLLTTGSLLLGVGFRLYRSAGRTTT